MPAEELTIVFNHESLSSELALREIQEILKELNVPHSGFELYGEPVEFSKVSAHLRKDGRKTFNLVGQGFVFHLGSVRNFSLDFLGIKSTRMQGDLWNRWASRFAENPNFVMAWVADADYEFWQNAQDPLQYRARGKSYDHLPIKSNDLPPPLEQTIIDISRNPGRRLLRLGYYEAVGALMWLGEAFWQLTGADWKKVELSDWLHTSKPSPHVLKIEAAEECFKTPDGRSGILQRKLRHLLFPNSE